MDAFELARLKHQKNLERRLRTQANQAVGGPVAVIETSAPVVETPKEKAVNTDGIVQVVVSLPCGEIEMCFRKRNVMANVTKSQMTKGNFQNALVKALEPLLGRVEVL